MIDRFFLPGLNANHTAALIDAFLVGFWVFPFKKKYITWTAFCLCIILLALTQSKGGIAICTFCFLLIYLKPLESSDERNKWILLTGIFALICATSPRYLHALQGDYSTTSRANLWDAALRIGYDFFPYGCGFNNFSEIFNIFYRLNSDSGRYIHPLNDLLWGWCEFGVIGFAFIFLLLYFGVIHSIFSKTNYWKINIIAFAFIGNCVFTSLMSVPLLIPFCTASIFVIVYVIYQEATWRWIFLGAICSLLIFPGACFTYGWTSSSTQIHLLSYNKSGFAEIASPSSFINRNGLVLTNDKSLWDSIYQCLRPLNSYSSLYFLAGSEGPADLHVDDLFYFSPKISTLDFPKFLHLKNVKNLILVLDYEPTAEQILECLKLTERSLKIIIVFPQVEGNPSTEMFATNSIYPEVFFIGVLPASVAKIDKWFPSVQRAMLSNKINKPID